MKRILPLLLAVLLLLSGCAQSGTDTGTYYPTFDEMVKNLNDRGYTVTTIEFAKDSDTPGKYISAFKGEDFIDFYWLDRAEDVAACEESLRARSYLTPYGRLISISGDAKHGNLAFCATSRAMEDAGIRLVEVKVGGPGEIKVNVGTN